MLELEGEEPLSPGALGYVCARTRDAYFTYVHKKLAEAEASGIKRSQIAARIRKSPSRFSKMVGAPGNWTLDTIAELLLAISKEELTPASLPLLAHSNSNSTPEDVFDHCCTQPFKFTIGTVMFSGGAAPSLNESASYVAV